MSQALLLTEADNDAPEATHEPSRRGWLNRPAILPRVLTFSGEASPLGGVGGQSEAAAGGLEIAPLA